MISLTHVPRARPFAIRATALALRRVYATPRQGEGSANWRDADGHQSAGRQDPASTTAMTPDRCQTFGGSLIGGRAFRIPGHQHCDAGLGHRRRFQAQAAHFRSCGCRRENCATPRFRSTRCGAPGLCDLRDHLLEAPTPSGSLRDSGAGLLTELTRGFDPHGAVGFALAPVYDCAACDALSRA